MRARIAIDLRVLLYPNESGVTVYTRNLTQRLLKNKEVSWDLFYQARNRCERIHKLFPSVRHIPHSNPRFHLKSMLRFLPLPEDYFEIKPDLLWMPDRRPFYRCPFPVVLTVHDEVPEKAKYSLSLKGRIWHHVFSLKRLLRITDAYIFPTLTVAQSVKTQKPKEITYEGTEPAPKPQRPSKLSKRIKSKDFFFTLSPADPRKRLKWVVNAAQRFPHFDFVIAGIKPSDGRFKKFSIEKMKNLHVLSFVTEAEKSWLYKNATAYLALSTLEGFDLPVLEAVQSSCPVLLSAIPVHQELYKDAEWVSTEEDLWRGLYLAKHGTRLRVPTPRGNYTWDLAAKRTLLFFLRVLGHENR